MKQNSLYRKGIVITVIVLFIGISFYSLSATLSSKIYYNEAHLSTINGNILYVGGSGPDNYTRIQDAVDNASEKDTIFVYNGTYFENIIIYKEIYLVGENRKTTIFDGSSIGDNIEIIADNVTINEFTIQHCWHYGIHIQSNHCNIYGNIIKDNYYPGISIEEAFYNTIRENTITNNTLNGKGICIDHSDHNIIEGNIINNNQGGGVSLYIAEKNIISNNTISNHIDAPGINLVWEVGYNEIFGNNISNNSIGIMINYEIAPDEIYHNNFINNLKHGDSHYQEIWDDGYPSGGNYWDDYNGTDQFYGENQDLLGSDGIGDENYAIPSEEIVDRYPFIEPNGWDKNYPPIVELFIGPSYGKPGVRYSFMAGFYDPDWDCFYIKFDWGDGSFSDWLGSYGNGCWVDVPHAWSKGGYNIRVKAKDLHGAESNWSEPIELRIESDPPTVEIIKPDKALYIMNKKIIPRFLRRPLIIGNIDVTVDANDFTGIDKVEFYIDNKLKSVDNSSPYIYTWMRDRLQFIHLHTIKVIAYDYCGNIASDKILVRKIL